MGDEAKVVDVEKDSEEGHGVRVRESQVGMVTLDGVNEVGDVESPKEGRKTTIFRQAFEDLDVGGSVGESVEDTVHEGVHGCVARGQVGYGNHGAERGAGRGRRQGKSVRYHRRVRC